MLYHVFVETKQLTRREKMSNSNEYGHVIHEGITIYLKQDAYLANDSMMLGNAGYFASGEDEEGNQYTICWEIKQFDEPQDDTDESEACDWDVFTVRLI
jgi:hypothetical protein